MYGRVGSEVERMRTKVGMIIADVGLGLETERGMINNPAGCVHRADTAFWRGMLCRGRARLCMERLSNTVLTDFCTGGWEASMDGRG